MYDYWNNKFDWPIPLSDGSGRQLVTLRDADNYIASLPERDQNEPQWQLAKADLLRAAAEIEAWHWFARSRIVNALYGVTEPPTVKETINCDVSLRLAFGL